jgi:uncharacterized protein (TIRG00374 family)
MKRWRNLLLGLVLSVFFLWIALRGLEWDNVGSILQEARWGYTLAAFGLISLGLFTRGIRWRALFGDQTPLMPTFHILNIGFLINNTLPLRVGELARAYLISRTSEPITVWGALSTIVAERILDMLTVVLLLAAVLPVLAVEASVITGGLIMGGIAIVGFAVLLIFAHRKDWAQALLNFVLRLLPFLKRFDFTGLLDRVLDGLQPLTTWRGLISTVIWTGLSWLVSLSIGWVLALTFPDLPQTATMRAALTLSVVAASFSIIVPFTLASVGPFEAAAVFALMTAGVPQEVAVAYAIVWHALSVLCYAVWGAVGMVSMGLSLGQIQAGAASLNQQQSATGTLDG